MQMTITQSLLVLEWVLFGIAHTESGHKDLSRQKHAKQSHPPTLD